MILAWASPFKWVLEYHAMQMFDPKLSKYELFFTDLNNFKSVKIEIDNLAGKGLTLILLRCGNWFKFSPTGTGSRVSPPRPPPSSGWTLLIFV